MDIQTVQNCTIVCVKLLKFKNYQDKHFCYVLRD